MLFVRFTVTLLVNKDCLSFKPISGLYNGGLWRFECHRIYKLTHSLPGNIQICFDIVYVNKFEEINICSYICMEKHYGKHKSL